MERSNESTFIFKPTSVNDFSRCISPNKADSFAKTFVAKANYQNLWPVLGCWVGKQLGGAIAWSVSKRRPVVANLQLLHTFAKHRRIGIGTALCLEFLDNLNVYNMNRSVEDAPVEYWRVSAEPEAVVFYEALGVKFIGKQKSGCQLAIAKLTATFDESVIDLSDEVVRKAVYRKGKGGCVEVFSKQK